MSSEAPIPSRSEIESALSGRTNTAASKKRERAKSHDFSFEASPRRRQVIGGDLTGVSKRKSYGLFSRYGEISIANWIAGLMVLLILIAFFWPKGVDPIKEVKGKANQVDSPSIYTESRLDDIDEPKSPTQSFSRDNDLDRAGQFREADRQEQKIRKLLTAAEAFVAKGAYTQPESGNAAMAYLSVLKLDPRNVPAKQGLDYINTRFLNAGEQAIADGNLALAESSLERLASVSTASEQYIEFSATLENWKIQSKIDDLLQNARLASDAGRLILPARENALYFYQQALVLDEGNSEAQAGINGIADTFIDRANEALIQGQYEAATGYLATVSVIDPRHPSIPMLEAMVTRAEPLAEQAQRVSTSDSTSSSATGNNPAPADVDTAAATPANNLNSTVDPLRVPRDQRVSSSRTPSQQANEQEAFDKQYLDRGLAAYYRGDYDAAAALLQPLADKGISRAQFRIGYMHYLGRGFKRDRKEADRVIRAALPAIQKFANEGRTWAQSDLGSLYEDGLVLPRDYGEAVYWYRSAAEAGYPGAQTNLGIMYARGRGVSTSRRTAIEWFQRAAKQGDIVAQRNLEAMGVE